METRISYWTMIELPPIHSQVGLICVSDNKADDIRKVELALQMTLDIINSCDDTAISKFVSQ